MPLVRLEPASDEEPGGAGAPASVAEAMPLDLPEQPQASSPSNRAARLLEDLRSLLLGFDGDPQDRGRALAEYQRLRGELVTGDPELLRRELDVVRVFADLCELTRNKPAAEETVDERVHSPREYFHAYLHSLDVDREHLPDAFRERLAQVLSHYDVTDLERTPALEEAVFRIFLAQQRSTSDLIVVTSLLQQWMGDPPPQDALGELAHEVLDRLVVATQLRYPVVGDLARSARFRWFDQPIVQAARAAVLEGVGDEVAYLATFPDADDSVQRLDALATMPEPIVRFLAERLEHGIPEREPMLEVLARRHYLGYELHDLRTLTAGGRPFVTCDYTLDDRPTLLVTTVGRLSELSEFVDPNGLAGSINAQLDSAKEGHEAVVDLYLHWPDVPDSPDAASLHLQNVLGGMAFARRVRRVAVAVCPGGDRPVSYFTFRPGPNGVLEDDLVRGVHPMVGRRLNLWRLRNFRITRLEAPEDVLLYHCVAPNNDADQRLVALSQVRELAVMRDADGHVTSLPQAERAVTNCLEAIRRARTARGSAGSRLDMNHVWVHVWPVIDAPLDGPTTLQRTIAPLTAGAGTRGIRAHRSHHGARRPQGPRGCDPVLLPAGLRGRGHCDQSADRPAQAARRLRPEEGYALASAPRRTL